MTITITARMIAYAVCCGMIALGLYFATRPTRPGANVFDAPLGFTLLFAGVVGAVMFWLGGRA